MLGTQQKIVPIIRVSYLKMLENSVGTKLFQNFYVYQGKKRLDATEEGRLSCAFFVSFILNNFGLLKNSHLTIQSTLKDMKNSGWFKIKKPRKGAVLVWEERKDKRGIHQHIGFYVGNQQAISNNSRQKIPARHHWTYGKRGSKSYRQALAILWNKKLAVNSQM